MAAISTQKLPKQKFGKTDLLCSKIGLGCMGLTGVYGVAPTESEAIELIQTAIREGCNFFDSAAVYAFRKNEEVLGKAIQGKREGLVIATKFGVEWDATKGAVTGLNSKPETVKKSCAESLSRLGISCIDLFYQHRVDPNTPIEETVKALAELIKEGKIRYYGLSEASAETIRKANKIHPVAAVQVEYSLWTRDIEENGVLSTCRELGIPIVAYSPVGRGFLSGQIKKPEDIPKDDWRASNPRFQGENFEKNLQLVNQVEAIANKKGCTPSQLALAWVLSKGDDMFPIPGTKRVKYLLENNASAHIKLTAEEIAQLDSIGSNVSGTRYAPAQMLALNK